MIRKILPFFLFLLIGSFSTNCGKKISISMVTTTSSGEKLPFLALRGEKWEAEPGAQYVKFHMYFDEVVPLSGVEVESCKNPFKDNVSVFVNFDEHVRYAEGGNKTGKVNFDPSVSARSVTLNFQKNEGVCLSAIRLFDENKKKYSIKTPKIVQTNVTASETSKLVQSYNVMNLFDSRYEYAYATDKGGVGVYLDFSFQDKVKIESIKIWNGYQRSDVHCVDNGRVKSIQLTGDDNYSETIALADELGSQEIKLPKPFQGKNLKMTIQDIYKGRKYGGILMSEMRFFDGSDWFLPDPTNMTREIAKVNSDRFNQAGILVALNRSLEGGEMNSLGVAVPSSDGEETGEEVAPSEDYDENGFRRSASFWILRFRSDGSFFLEGNTTREGEGTMVNQRFFALGNYETEKVDERGLQMRIFGFLRNTKTTEEVIYGEGDCNGCGRDCNKLGLGVDPNSVEKIFSESIEIRKVDGKFFVKNISRKGNLDFTELELLLQ